MDYGLASVAQFQRRFQPRDRHLPVIVGLFSFLAGRLSVWMIGNLISARSFTGKVTEKAGPRAAMAALGPAFRRVLELVTGDEVHRQSSGPA